MPERKTNFKFIKKFKNEGKFNEYRDNYEFQLSIYSSNLVTCTVCDESKPFHQMRSRRFECSNDNCYKFKKCPATLKSHLCLLNGKVKLYTNLEGHNSDEIDDGPRRGIFKPIKEFIRGLLKEQPLLTSRKILSKIYKWSNQMAWFEPSSKFCQAGALFKW